MKTEKAPEKTTPSDSTESITNNHENGKKESCERISESKKFTSTGGHDKNRDNVEGDVKVVVRNQSVERNAENANVLCDICKENICDCGCDSKTKGTCSDVKSTETAAVIVKPDNSKSASGQDSKGVYTDRFSDASNLAGSEKDVSGRGKTTQTTSKSVSQENISSSTSEQANHHGVSHSVSTSANTEKSSPSVSLSSIKKLVSQVSQKIASDNLSAGQKSKSFGDTIGMIKSSLRPNVFPPHVGNCINSSDSVSDQSVFLNATDRLDSIRDVHENANFNQLLLSNMLKLTSPPNQQVFPNQQSLLPIPVQGMIRGYQHGALPNVGPAFSQIPMHNVSRFTIPNSEVGQAVGNVLVNQGNSSFPDYVSFPWMNRKAKVKRAKSKKEKKIPNYFDSESPPPNVDVSKLKDKGHGHIPKQKIASFLENPSEFMEQQTALVNSSISSTSPSPKGQSEIYTEVCEPPKRSESVDSDRLTVASRSDSVNSDRISSPNKDNGGFSSDKDSEVARETVSDIVTSNALVAASSVTSKEESLSTSIQTVTHGPQRKEDDIALDTVESKPPSSLPHLPSAVVHHPPETSQTSTCQSRPSDEKIKPATLLKQSTPHPLAAMLSHAGTNQAFQQMFPNVVQEALLQTVSICSEQNSLLLGQTTDSVSSAKQMIINSPPNPTKHICNNRSHVGRPVQTPIRQILENQNKNEFPASNLLSAAAKAQLIQQQNQLNLMLAQQMNGEICNPFYNPQIMSMQGTTSYGPVNLSVDSNVPVLNTLIAQPNAAFVASGNPTDNANDRTQSKEHLPSTGTSKISELLNKSNSLVKKPPDAGPASRRGDKHNSVENPAVLQQQCNSEISKTGNVPVQQLHMPDSVNHPVNNINVSQQMVNQQQLMQMFSAMGFPFMPIGQLDLTANHLNNNGPAGQMPFANTQLLHSQANAVTDRIGLTPSSCHPGSANNAMIQPFAAPGYNISTTIPSVKTTSIGNIQGNSGSHLQFQGSVLQNQNLLCPTNIQELNMLGPGCGPNGSSAVFQGFNQVAADQNIDRKPDQQNYALSEASVVVMQNGIPMIQMVAPNQIPVGSNVDKTNVPQLTLSNHGVGIQNLMQNNSQGTVSSSRPVVPLNLINVQQSWNNGNTNLTAMQLQTLQLQQQLLHQIQQVQGMQSLINHFNIQGLTNSTAPVTSGMQGSIPISGVPIAVSCNTNSSSETVHSVSNPVAHTSDNRQTAACIPKAEGTSDVSSCVITSTVKSSRPDSVSTTCSLQSESHDTLMVDKVSVAAADTTQDSPVQSKSSTTRTVDIGTETEAFDDGEDDDEDDEEETSEENGANDESREASEKEVEEESDSESEPDEPCEKQVKLDPKQSSDLLTSSRASGAKSCYSMALASVTAQRNRTKEIESLKRSRKRYYSSMTDFTTVKSGSSDKSLRLVIRKRTGLSPVKMSVADSPEDSDLQFKKLPTDTKQKLKNLSPKTIRTDKPINALRSGGLKFQRKQSVCETSKDLHSNRSYRNKGKKKANDHTLIEMSVENSLSNTVTECVGNKLKAGKNGCSETIRQDEPVKLSKDVDTKEKSVDCDSSSSIEDVMEHHFQSSPLVVTSVDEAEPSTTVFDTECSVEKERTQNELTSRIAAALTVQKGRWHLTASPKKLKHDTNTSVGETAEKMERGVKRSRSLVEFESEGMFIICFQRHF